MLLRGTLRMLSCDYVAMASAPRASFPSTPVVFCLKDPWSLVIMRKICLAGQTEVHHFLVGHFREDFRKAFQEQNPGVKSMRDIGKACGEKWKTMTYEEKVQYYDIATQKRAEFDRAMADYVKRKESGEDKEVEDSDSDY